MLCENPDLGQSLALSHLQNKPWHCVAVVFVGDLAGKAARQRGPCWRWPGLGWHTGSGG